MGNEGTLFDHCSRLDEILHTGVCREILFNLNGNFVGVYTDLATILLEWYEGLDKKELADE